MRIFSIGLSLALVAPVAMAWDATESFKKAFPSVVVEEEKPSFIPGYTQLDVRGGTQAHISPDGYFFVADVYKLSEDSGVLNLSERVRQKERLELLATAAAADPVIFAAEGEKKASITVFTDVDCAYCRKFHNEVPELQKAGIEVKYLAYPRAGVISDTGSKMQSVWCSSNQQESMTLAKTGAVPNELVCETPIKAHYELGKQVGVSGTPTIVLDSGAVIPGYQAAKTLIRVIDANS